VCLLGFVCLFACFVLLSGPQETVLRLLNVLAGISAGRSYLLQDSRLVSVRTQGSGASGGG
jgi:hypothetical protein